MTKTLIESRTNRLGLEVTHQILPTGVEQLRCYRCGELVATRLAERHDGRVIGACIVLHDVRLPREDRAEIVRALDEAVRILRDGRGLCEAA